MTHTVLVIFRIEKRRKTYNKNLNLITTHLSQIVILKMYTRIRIWLGAIRV